MKCNIAKIFFSICIFFLAIQYNLSLHLAQSGVTLHYVIWVCGLIFYSPQDLYELAKLHSSTKNSVYATLYRFCKAAENLHDGNYVMGQVPAELVYLCRYYNFLVVTECYEFFARRQSVKAAAAVPFRLHDLMTDYGL